MGTREKNVVGVRKVVYTIVQEVSTSMSTPKTTKKRIPPSKASTSKRRRSHIDSIGKGSEEVPPVPQEAALDFNKGKSIDKGNKTIPIPWKVTRLPTKGDQWIEDMDA